ncbi:MAG: hypothetical protein AB7L76_20900 [Burkholderiaceae bacterium]
MYTDPTEPKDGDFAAYVERLSGSSASSPGLVPRSVKAATRRRGADARAAVSSSTAGAAAGTAGPGPGAAWGRSPSAAGTPATGMQTTGNTAARARTGAAAGAPPDLDAAMRQLAGGLRGGAAALARLLGIAGITLIALSLIGLWSISLAPGIMLLIASMLLGRKLNKR